jgi:hypothetical protein
VTALYYLWPPPWDPPPWNPPWELPPNLAPPWEEEALVTPPWLEPLNALGWMPGEPCDVPP